MKSSFEGRQHPGHVPAQLKEYNMYRSLLLKFCKACSENHLQPNQFFGYPIKKGSSITREVAWKGLKGSLLRCLTGSEASADKKLQCQLYFLSHQVLADVEELVRRPFGRVTGASIGSGSGGAHGSKLFLTRLAESPGCTPLEKIHNELVDHLLKHEDAKVLSILGLEVKEKSLLWMYHGREFCVTDTEHILCKLSIICKNNHTSRNTSLTPIASRTDCWPRRLLECLAILKGDEKTDREVLDEFA